MRERQVDKRTLLISKLDHRKNCRRARYFPGGKTNLGDPALEIIKGNPVDNNRASPSAPGDFISFDFAEMEQVGNSLFRAKDDWVHFGE